MNQVFLSDAELYYSESFSSANNEINDEEAHHILRVMRHAEGDEIYVTNGKGKIYHCLINNTSKKSLNLDILSEYSYINNLKNIKICIPRLRTQDRLEFAIEKCVELGYTNLVIYESDNGVGRKEKTERWEKIAVSAMKQSLRSFLPEITFSKNIFSEEENTRILGFDQHGTEYLKDYILNTGINGNIKVIIGPEGGFSKREYEELEKHTSLKLTKNRLRSETAVITAASMISQFLV